MNDLAAPQLSESQARTLCEKIVHEAENLRDLLLQLRDGQGWIALGYKTWAKCCTMEFGYSKQYANRLIKAKEICEQVETNCSQTAWCRDRSGTAMNECQARELGKVDPDKRRAVLAWAVEKAEGKRITAAAIRRAANNVMEQEPDDEDDEPVTCNSEHVDEKLDEKPEQEEAIHTQSPTKSKTEIHSEWLSEATDELSDLCASHAKLAEYLDGLATLARESEPAVMAAMLENEATKLRT
jgi:hypothetical protein